MISESAALPGRDTAMAGLRPHHGSGRYITPPWPEGAEVAEFALGCFWGAERKFWQTPGVIVTAVGYSGGFTPNPSCREVCSGRTGHAESVLVVFDPTQVTYDQLLAVFWESHDPTQGMRQGNDVGTQYRSAIYTHSAEQATSAAASRERYQAALDKRGLGAITTEVQSAGAFYWAEDDHQQYLSKHPNGYCGLGGTGVSCPVGLGADDA
jgi:peptide-methionine (S)-S-oxide reductase